MDGSNLLVEMMERGYTPNVVTFGALIQQLLNENKYFEMEINKSSTPRLSSLLYVCCTCTFTSYI